MWAPLNNLNQNFGSSTGIIKLWCPPNYSDSSGWSTEGNFSEKLWAYFFIPNGFYNTGVNEFTFNFSYEYIFEPIEIYHNGIQQSEMFWHLEPTDKKKVSLLTDNETKLPYLIVPSLGELNYFPERRYFIPINNIC